jgi:hypothetical protein
MVSTPNFAFPSRCLAVGLSLVLATGPALAATPRNVSDIAYQDAGWGSKELRSRGYARISAHRHHGKMVEYWWNGRANNCLKAVEIDGKYNSVDTTSGTDCNQYHQEANEGSDAAAIAIGAAALIGVAALAHNSHERNEKHGENKESVADFDRGYRDGSHHERYHNYNNSSAYADGYSSGQQYRDDQTSYRSHNGRHSGRHSYVSLEDLVGARASSADSELRARGFKDTGGYKRHGKSFVSWYNRSTRQCVNAVTKDGRVRRFETLDEGNCT